MSGPLTERERERLRAWAMGNAGRFAVTCSLILRLLAEPTGSPGPNVRADDEEGGGSRLAAEDVAFRASGLRLELLRAALHAPAGFIAADMEERFIGGRAPQMRANECEHMGWLERVREDDGSPTLRMGPHGSRQQVFRITAGGRAVVATSEARPC